MARRTQLLKHWTAVPLGQHPDLPLQVAIADEFGVLPGSLELRASVSVIAGLNGVGKTRLLGLIESSLGEKARLVSLHDLCAWLMRVLRERNDADEVTEESSALEVSTDTFGALRAIVGRNYDEIQWYAVEVEDSPFEQIVDEAIAPYFVVSEGTVTYEMDKMGLGELAAHVLLWVIWYLRDKENLFLLLDEPDAFFPPSSREALIDYIGSVAVTRKQGFVITTHSRELIERGLMYEKVLTYMRRGDGVVEFSDQQPELREIVEKVLYPEDVLQVVAWVEDDAAYALTRALLNRIDRPLSRQIALYWGQGGGTLEALRQHLPRPERPPRALEFMLIWDGDENSKEDAPGSWPAVLLPGETSPDTLFVQYADKATLASELKIAPAVLGAALDNAAGKDPHDWTADVIDLADMDRSAVLRALAEATLDGNPELVEEFRATLIQSGLTAFRILEE